MSLSVKLIIGKRPDRLDINFALSAIRVSAADRQKPVTANFQVTWQGKAENKRQKSGIGKIKNLFAAKAQRKPKPFPTADAHRLTPMGKGLTPTGRAGEICFLPHCAHGIAIDRRIGGQNRHPVHDGLANQHTVERVFMVIRQAIELQHRFLLQGQGFNTM